jgi:glucosamine--fructose-6-phosphate aminotransferase (isomerizing)
MRRSAIIEGDYLRDILNQPEALEDTFKVLMEDSALTTVASRLSSGHFKRIILTGMGSSFYALYPLYLQLIGSGYRTAAVETSELVHYMPNLFDQDTIILAVSQSGFSAEMLRLIEVNDHRGTIIAVTNTPDSPLARHADVSFLIHAGAESAVSTKTYVATLMALEWVGAVLRKSKCEDVIDELALAAAAVGSYLKNWREHVEGALARMEGIQQLFLVGRGPSMAAVSTGGLILKESTHFHAEGMNSAAFRHGPFELLNEGCFVLTFLGDARTGILNRNLARDVEKHGGIGQLVSEGESCSTFRLPSVPPRLLPIVEILPVQMISLALAAHAGREAGRLTLATKVTTTE